MAYISKHTGHSILKAVLFSSPRSPYQSLPFSHDSNVSVKKLDLWVCCLLTKLLLLFLLALYIPVINNITIKVTWYIWGKNSKNRQLWTFWPVIQLIYHLFKIQKRLFVGFWKDGLLAKLQTSRSCIFSLFLPRKYQVSLNPYIFRSS